MHDHIVLMYQVVPKVRATTLTLHARKKWFIPLDRGCTFTDIHHFSSDWIIPISRTEENLMSTIIQIQKMSDIEQRAVIKFFLPEKD